MTNQVKTLDGRLVTPPTLTAAEQQSPYVAFFNAEMAKPEQHLVDELAKGEINPENALKFEDLNELLKDGYLASELGYCYLPDGTGYVSSIVQMPNVTAEMLDWWFIWHPLESVRYKIWNNKAHFDTKVSDADRARLADKTLSYKERLWGTTHFVTEDIGMGASEIDIHFKSPAEFGFDMEKFNQSKVQSAILATGLGGATRMAHIARPRADGKGIELRTRFWFAPHNGQSVPMELIRGLTYHAVEEYSHLAHMLPLVWQQFGDK